MTQEMLDELRTSLRAFAVERDWEKFHSPKNLTMALSAEAGELVEVFQWLTQEESFLEPGSKAMARAQEEIGDIMNYLVRLADVLDIDLIACGLKKVEMNRKKYPVSKSFGVATKYTEFEDHP